METQSQVTGIGQPLAQRQPTPTSAADEINAAVVRVQRMMYGGRYDLEGALENLRVASENLRDLTETLRAQPSLLLRSAAPERTNQLEITP